MRTLFETDINNYDPSWPVFVRPSVRAIIVRDSKIAMIHAKRYNYYRFPGGGLNEDESFEDALVRETMEETGLVIDRSSIREFGYVCRRQKDDITSENRIFVQENYYYICSVTDETAPQNLDQYEKEERFVLEWVDPVAAIYTNRHRMHGPKDRRMISRESRILELVHYGLEQVSPEIYRLPSSDSPLSSDVFLIYGNSGCYVFDVGSNAVASSLLNGINNKTVIISHFHQDHSFNLRSINFDCLIDGNLDDDIDLDDGVRLHISNIVSSHCKSSIMVCVNDSYLLVGDSLYGTVVDAKAGYNVQKLKQTIRCIENSPAHTVILSHTRRSYSKDEVLSRLRKIYQTRDRNSFFICSANPFSDAE